MQADRRHLTHRAGYRTGPRHRSPAFRPAHRTARRRSPCSKPARGRSRDRAARSRRCPAHARSACTSSGPPPLRAPPGRRRTGCAVPRGREWRAPRAPPPPRVHLSRRRAVWRALNLAARVAACRLSQRPPASARPIFPSQQGSPATPVDPRCALARPRLTGRACASPRSRQPEARRRRSRRPLRLCRR